MNGSRTPVEIDSEWLRYFVVALFDRVGGSGGSGTGDLETAQYDDAGIDDLKAAVARLSDETQHIVSPTHVVEIADGASGLMAEIDALRTRIEALEQSS